MGKSRKIGKLEEMWREYFRRLNESQGFDIEGLIAPRGVCPVVPGDLGTGRVKILVHLYAKLGLHRYNMLRGSNFELVGISKFNSKLHVPTVYYITLDAIDAATGMRVVFQVKVSEQRIRYLHLICTIARPTVPKITHPFREISAQCQCIFSSVDDFYKGSLPEWPPSEDAFNDTKRFYVVKKSELQNHSWIHLYLELALAVKSRTLKEDDLSHLEIVKVVIETKEAVEPPEGRLHAKCAIVYIRFKNLAKTEIAKDYLAIVRRVFNETTGDLMLEGNTASWEKGFNEPAVRELVLQGNTGSSGKGFNTDEQGPKKRSKSDECQSGIEVDHLKGHEKVASTRRSARIPKPIRRFHP